MASTGIIFNNGVNIWSGGSDLLTALVKAITNEWDIQSTEYDDYLKLLGYKSVTPLTINEEYFSIGGDREIDRINENWVKPEYEITKLPWKGFKIQEYGGKITTSYLFYKWLQSSSTLEGADSSVKAERANVARQGKRLINAIKMRCLMEGIKVLTNGFSVSVSNGAGSATPKGLPLFSIYHTARNGNLVFANTANTHLPLTADAAWVAALQYAINQLNTKVVGENGYELERPKNGYDLMVSRDLAVIARQLLNQSWTAVVQATAWIDWSILKANQFMFEGNRVNVVELPFLGKIDNDGNQIWTANMRFLRNADVINDSEALKCITLYPPEIKNYMVNDTDAYVIDVRAWFAFDHFGAELWLFGSKWDNSAQTV